MFEFIVGTLLGLFLSLFTVWYAKFLVKVGK